MVLMHALAITASTILALVSAFPAVPAVKEVRQTYQNNTQEFYIKLKVTHGSHKYNGYYLQTYHTGAGTADPVFANVTSSPAFLNGTQLQFNAGDYPFSVVAGPGDDNYARWEPVTIDAGYGEGDFYIDSKLGIQLDSEEFGGWIECEWWHGDNYPQLFQLINGYDSGPGYTTTNLPSSCANILLIPEYF